MNDSTPETGSSPRRQLIAFLGEDGADRECVPVVASFPAHVGNAAGLAALVEAAAVDAGMSFARYQQLMATFSPPPIGEIERTPRPAHRPAYLWQNGFGATLEELWEMAQRHLEANPKMAKIEAFAAALQEARKSAKMGRLSNDAAKDGAAKLKQACRRFQVHALGAGKTITQK